MKRGILLFFGILIFAPCWPLAMDAVARTSISAAFGSAGCAAAGLLLVLGAALRT
jgi:hypothetical protein